MSHVIDHLYDLQQAPTLVAVRLSPVSWIWPILEKGRTAELIERIGAVNQTRDDVTRRFVWDPHR